MNKHYKDGPAGIEIRIPPEMAGCDKARLVGNVLEEITGQIYEEDRQDLDTQIYTVYKALYTGSGTDLAAFQGLWNYNLVGNYDLAHSYSSLFGVKVFPGETLIYTMSYKDEKSQHFYPADLFEDYGQTKMGIDYARTIMRAIDLKTGKILYYPMVYEAPGCATLYINTTHIPGNVERFNFEEDAREFLRQYDK